MSPLPKLTFQLRKWRTNDFKPFANSAKKLKNLAGRAGQGSDAFENARNKLLRLAQNGQANSIPEEIQRPVDVRALTFLFGDENFRVKTQITKDMLDSLHKPRTPLGLLSLMQLLGVFFRFFDQLADGGQNVFGYFCALLKKELAVRARGRAKQRSDLAILYHNRWLFSLDGPAMLVGKVLQNNLELEPAFARFALQHYRHDARFHMVCRFRYYLKQLRQLPVGADGPVLVEVCKEEVYDAPAGGDRLLGHKILEILIDRASPDTISDAWRGVILTIAGDPRVAESSGRFVKWWFKLGRKRQNKVRAWLSGFDLRLFLEALEDYGDSQAQEDLQRMFPARKAFLEGLLKQKLIQHARLFVSRGAEAYLHQHYGDNELPEYAQVQDPYRSMIYLQIGGCHMIEGGHSFRLRLYPKLPSETTITQYARKRFTPDSLGKGLQMLYHKTYGDNARSLSVVHHPNRRWLAEAIQFLRQEDIQLDVEQLLEAGAYQQFKRQYGIF